MYPRCVDRPRLWNAQIDALSDAYELIVYDVRGHGKTGSSAERRYIVELFAADLYALIDELNLASIQAPTLVLNGEYETQSVYTHTAHMGRLIPTVRTAMVPNAGHTSNMENAAAFNREVQNFLSTLGD